MKLRKQLRFLYRALRDEVADALIENHNHEPFHIRGSGCMLCRLLDLRFPLATLQLAREHNYILPWFATELEFINLIGLDRFKKKIKKEMLVIKNMPKKTCECCGGTVIIFQPLSTLATKLLQTKKSEWYADCMECGTNTPFTKKDIPLKLLTLVRGRLARAKRRRRTLRDQSTTELIQHLTHGPIGHVPGVGHAVPQPAPPAGWTVVNEPTAPAQTGPIANWVVEP